MSAYDVQSVEFIRVGVFCATIAGIYYLTLRRLWVSWRKRPVRTRIDRLFYSRATGILLTTLAILGLLCIAYGFWIEPRWLKVTQYDISTPKLPKGTEVRIVHLADLHVRNKGLRERTLPQLVRSLRPDLSLHTGDFFGRTENVEPIVVDLLTSWDVPQYTCQGNLDFLGDFGGTMERAGVTILNGATDAIQINGAHLTVTGFASGSEQTMAAGLRDLPENAYNILLYHYPHGFPQTWGTGADLMLAGHTHGGQVRLPFYGALITFDRYGKRWEGGIYKENGAYLLVSRGLGCEPFTPEARFLCRPEVVVIDLKGTGGPS